MAKRLEGKSAVITGGAGGIGRLIALEMVREGAKVVINDLGKAPGDSGSDRSQADKVVDEIKKAGGTAIANYDSVADFAAAENVINTCVKNFGGIDILVNCAGGSGGEGNNIWEMSEKDWDITIAVNLKGTFNTCRHAIPLMMKQKKGRIINFSSPAWLGGSASIAYGAAKGGVVTLTRAIAAQMVMEGSGVTCNAIAPTAGGPMRRQRQTSSEAQRVQTQGVPSRWERLYKAGQITRQLLEINLGKTGPPGPQHCTSIVVYLATDEAAVVNGRVFVTSPGRVALYSVPAEVKGLYKDGVWTLDELMNIMPVSLAQDIMTVPSP